MCSTIIIRSVLHSPGFRGPERLILLCLRSENYFKASRKLNSCKSGLFSQHIIQPIIPTFFDLNSPLVFIASFFIYVSHDHDSMCATFSRPRGPSRYLKYCLRHPKMFRSGLEAYCTFIAKVQQNGFCSKFRVDFFLNSPLVFIACFFIYVSHDHDSTCATFPRLQGTRIMILRHVEQTYATEFKTDFL